MRHWSPKLVMRRQCVLRRPSTRTQATETNAVHQPGMRMGDTFGQGSTGVISDTCAHAGTHVTESEATVSQATVASASRITRRTVSWLTPNSAARERRLLVAARDWIEASWTGVSMRARWR